MTASHRAPAQGHTRWRRFGAMMTLSAAASVGMLALVSEGALAANMQVSGGQFKVGASRLDATGFVQYGAVNQRFWDSESDPQSGGIQQPPGFVVDPAGQQKAVLLPVATSAMREAKLTNLCQSVLVKVPMVNQYVTLRISAGNKGTDVVGKNMTVDLTQLDGQNAVFEGMEIGNDASTVSKAGDLPNGAGQGFPGIFAQQADRLVVTDLKQTAWATTAGSFTLPNLSLKLVMGKQECF